MERKLKIKLFLLDLFRIKYCKKCHSTHLDNGYWSRGWSNLGGWGGDIGGSGVRCFDCGDIVFEQSKEEYEKGLPEWCVCFR